MKICLCLYGYFNNREDQNSGMKGYSYIKENILDKYENVDVFIHSWDLENERKIKELYKPARSWFEKQIDFIPIANARGVYQEEIDKIFDRNRTIYSQCTIQASLSFFYSRGTSLVIKKHYEKDHNFNYDVVITARFDLGYRSGMHRGYNVSQINFNPNNDMEYIYSSMWLQANAGYGDQWFYSNSANMDKLILMQDQALNEFKVGSDYHTLLTTAWPDSNSDDEFSNEVFKSIESKSKNLMKYPTWQIINNHLFHKFFFIKNNLYEISKYI